MFRIALTTTLAVLMAGCGGDTPPASPTPGTSVSDVDSHAAAAAEFEIDIAVNVPCVDAALTTDPFAPVWDTAPLTEINLLPQVVTTPHLDTPGVAKLDVKMLHDGTRVAFRLEWADDTASGEVDFEKSSDGVAIEIPANAPNSALPNVMMGDADNAVAVALWRYVYQEIADGHGHGISRLYPNAVFDYYPSSGSKRPDAKDELDRLTKPGVAAENPVSTQRAPVADLTARGFGSLGPAAVQSADGRGTHQNGRWTVVVTRPLAGASDAVRLRPGEPTAVAFAIWEGSNNQRGSRKTWSMWTGILLMPGDDA